MRKILFVLCLLMGYITGLFAEEKTYTLDATTLQSSTSGSCTFSSGLTITNGGKKTLQAQSGTAFLKFSNGVQYTVSGIPSGETVESVVFYGFPHDAGDQCYLAEFNGVTEDPSVADFSDGTAESPKAYDFQGWAIKGSFTFTARIAQTCLWVKITTTTDKVLKFEKDAYSFDLTDLTANGHMPEPIANTTGSTVTYVVGDTFW